uniref:FTH domain-containing protein n=1 Tax=Caenorhabditis tropicalis TaxID=1561998 RepID=A0A1I7U6K3_9PELO
MTSDIPENVLQSGLIYEYVHRVSPEQAHRNIIDTINMGTKEAVYRLWNSKLGVADLHFPVIEPFEPPVKKKAKTSESSVTQMKLMDVDGLKYVEKVYTDLAEQEIRKILEIDTHVSWDNFPRIMKIRRMAKETLTYKMILPYDSLEVYNKHRCIEFVMRDERKEKEYRVTYKSWQERCLVEDGIDETRIMGKKYQSVAAKEFFFLIQNRQREIKELRFFIKSRVIENQLTWPSTKFYWKIDKYMKAAPQIKPKVDEFEFHFFQLENDRTADQGMILAVFPHFDPQDKVHFVCKNELPVALNREFMNLDEIWRNFGNFELTNMFVSDFMLVTGFDNVYMVFSEFSMKKLLRASKKYEPPGETIEERAWKTKFHIKNEFDFASAMLCFKGKDYEEIKEVLCIPKKEEEE